jgi:cell division protein FtsL
MATLDRLAPPLSTPVASTWAPRRAIAAAFTTVVAIALLQVAQSSSFAHTGQNIQRLEQEKSALTAEVHLLEAEIAALASLERVERHARERLAMLPPRRTDHLSVDVAAPDGFLLPRPLTAEHSGHSDGGPWWQTLLRVLPFR